MHGPSRWPRSRPAMTKGLIAFLIALQAGCATRDAIDRRYTVVSWFECVTNGAHVYPSRC